MIQFLPLLTLLAVLAVLGPFVGWLSTRSRLRWWSSHPWKSVVFWSVALVVLRLALGGTPLVQVQPASLALSVGIGFVIGYMLLYLSLVRGIMLSWFEKRPDRVAPRFFAILLIPALQALMGHWWSTRSQRPT